MPSITFWNRLEPRPRSRSVRRALAARVRDPLWFLTRQWQFGEFQGEDAASPARVECEATFAPIDQWRTTGAEPHDFDFDNSAPLEAVVESEPFTPDLATAVELGQKFESLLRKDGLSDLISEFRKAFPFPLPSENLNREQDRELDRFLQVCGRRVTHGVELFKEACNPENGLPEQPEISNDQKAQKVLGVLEDFCDWVKKVFGDLGKVDAPAWEPQRLEYYTDVLATVPDGHHKWRRKGFNASSGREGEFDWYAFDEVESLLLENFPEGDEPQESETHLLLPMNVRFRGMPNARWWHFEHGSVDFGSVQPDLCELGKMILMDFMLVHSNDWFIVPIVHKVGTVCRIDSFQVHDVFGGVTRVDRADRKTAADGWTMFSTTIRGQEGEIGDYFILPPSATVFALSSEPIEQVRWLRDEMANMVWAVEHTTENGIGQPWPGYERAFSGKGHVTSDDTEGEASLALKYLIQTTVPEHWTPFLPVLLDDQKRQVALEKTAMRDPIKGLIEPAGRILQGILQVREEEVPHAGVEVSRVVRRSRWIDGSTHLWIARRKRAGTGEGSSGLRFDVAVPPKRASGGQE